MAAVTTEQATHTPGPWSVCYDHPDQKCRDSIAYIRAPHTEDFDCGAETAVVYGCKGNEERRANARLMAAAPDLLDALRVAYSDIQRLPGHTIDMLGRIEAAVVKATGEAS